MYPKIDEKLKELQIEIGCEIGRKERLAYANGYKEGWQDRDGGKLTADAKRMGLGVSERRGEAGVLPRPCDGPAYDGCDEWDFFSKVVEEVGEVARALRQWLMFPLDNEEQHRDRLFCECADAITAITSLMHKCGCDNTEKRSEYFRRVNESNAKRNGGRRFKA